MVACPALVFGVTTASGATVGTAYSLNAGVTGNTAMVVYSISPILPNGLSIDTATGAIFGMPNVSVASNTYTVTATQGTCSNTQNYTFAVVCPAILFTNTTATNAIVGTLYTLSAGATGNTATLTYSVSPILPNGLGLNTATGAISGTPNVSAISNIYTVTATQGTCSNTQNYTFAVVCPGFSITPATLPNGIIGTPYNQTLSTNLTGTLTWSISPMLPAGLLFSTTSGAISGATNTVTASTAYAISVANATCSASQTYNLAFAVPCSVVDLGLASLPNATVGTPYSQTFTASGGAAGASYAFTTTTTLPTGMTLSSAGLLSGMPTGAIVVTFTVTATSTPNGCVGTKVYTLTIVANPTTSISNTLSNEVKVSPNPSFGVFNIDLGSLNVSKSLARVYNVQGVSVHTSKASNNMSISLENLPAGMYFLEINTEKGSILKKLVKE